MKSYIISSSDVKYETNISMEDTPLEIVKNFCEENPDDAQYIFSNEKAHQQLLRDGELDEGAVWEAAASAVKFGLDNLTAIVDWNKVQLDGTTDEIMPLRDLPGKWKAFGWNVLRCDGHDLTALDAALDAAAACKGVPTVILADTVKGKGVSFMEGKSAWHGKAIPDAEFAQAMQELGGNV